MHFFEFLDLLGTASFAISGTLFAIKKRMDTFGVFIIAFVTAVGGGTLRDILIDANQITWMSNLHYVYTIAIAVVFAILLRHKIGYLSKSLFFVRCYRTRHIYHYRYRNRITIQFSSGNLCVTRNDYCHFWRCYQRYIKQ